MAVYATSYATTAEEIDDNPARLRVALGKNTQLKQKIVDRRIKSQNETMVVQKLRDCPSVVAVVRPRKQAVYVLLGVHRPIVLYDDDGVRTDPYQPKNCPVKFYLARSAMVYENLTCYVPVACSCKDFIMRATSTRSVPKKSPLLAPSVNDRNLSGDAAVMGAVMGCKHMMAVSNWVKQGGF